MACDISGKNYMVPLLIYGLFVVYGSLVPLEFNQLTFDVAWSNFKNIPWLNLGMYSRADWIANILLYIPFAFLFCAQLHTKKDASVLRLIKSLFVLLLSLSLAVSVEFCQQFFPPRTVSLNDLLAESIGTLIGILIWWSNGEFVVRSWQWLRRPDQMGASVFLAFYSVLYLLHALFPFDFVISIVELDKSLSLKKFEWLGASDLKSGLFMLASNLIQLVLSIPVGFFLFCWFKKHHLNPHGIVFFGAAAGLLIETTQIFLISGYFSLISVVARGSGIVIGFRLFQKPIDWRRMLEQVRGFVWLLILPYLVVLAYFNGWNAELEKVDVAQILNKLEDIKWLPFYYHYYVPETVALTSLLYVMAMYLPIGAVVGFFKTPVFRNRLVAVGLAVFLAVIVESGKLFFMTKHPDPTNVLIAAASAWMGFYVIGCIDGQGRNGYVSAGFNSDIKPEESRETPINGTRQNHAERFRPNMAQPVEKVGWVGRGLALALLGFSGWHILGFPVFSVPLFLGMGFYCVLLWMWPSAWLWIIPALAPTLDFSAASGRLFFSEFDHLVLVTVAIGLLSGHWYLRGIARANFGRGFYILLILLLVSYFVSIFQGLLPLPALDANAFTNYYSPFNAIRVVKGFLGALILLPMLGVQPDMVKAKKLFSLGMLSGLLGVIGVAVWERITFPGLFNYDSDYRITAGFNSMHTGGGHIDAYLMLTAPFILALAMMRRFKTLWCVMGLGVLASLVYVVMVTYSRGPYIGFLVEVMVLLACLFVRWRATIHQSVRSFWFVPGVLLLIVAVAVPVLRGSYIQDRFSRVGEDFQIRKSHWRDALEMMDEGFVTDFWGMGLGSYPRTYYWRNSENTVPSMYQFRQDSEGLYLTLSPGDSLYVEQKVDVVPNATYRLLLEARGHSEKTSFTIALCEKALLYSYNCAWNSLSLPGSETGEWKSNERMISTTTFAFKDRLISQLFRRPVKLSLYNGDGKAVIDVKSVKLINGDGEDLIKNGDFSHAMDNWFFSTDNHLPWHIKNVWVQQLFDQGWFGLIIFCCFIVYCLFVYCRGLNKNDFFSVIGLTSLSGFLVVGVVDSPFDEPRLTFLFFLVCYIFLSGQGQKIGFARSNKSLISNNS